MVYNNYDKTILKIFTLSICYGIKIASILFNKANENKKFNTAVRKGRKYF